MIEGTCNARIVTCTKQRGDVTVLIVLLSVSLVTQLVIAAALFRFATVARNSGQQLVADVSNSIRSCLIPAKEGEPAPIAAFADQIAIIFAARIMQQIKQATSGIASGQSRQESAEALEAVTGSSPALGILAAMLPKSIRNKMIRNPQMLRQLSLFRGGGNGAESDGGSSIAARLRQS